MDQYFDQEYALNQQICMLDQSQQINYWSNYSKDELNPSNNQYDYNNSYNGSQQQNYQNQGYQNQQQQIIIEEQQDSQNDFEQEQDVIIDNSSYNQNKQLSSGLIDLSPTQQSSINLSSSSSGGGGGCIFQFVDWSTIDEDKHINTPLKKQLQKQNKRRNKQIALYQSINQDRNIKLVTGLSISEDGIVRLSANLGQVSFGFQHQKIVQIQELKKYGIVQMTLQNDDIDEIALSDALTLVQKQHYHGMNDLLSKIKTHYFHINCMRQVLSTMKIKEQEFQEYISDCLNYLQVKYDNSQMYWFAIGRLNPELKDVQILHTGFSTAYLDFLGLDTNTLSSIILRNHKIDLIQDSKQIIDLTLMGLTTKVNLKSNEDELFSSDIVTFDGFPIKLIQTKKKISYNQVISCSQNEIIREQVINQEYNQYQQQDSNSQQNKFSSQQQQQMNKDQKLQNQKQQNSENDCYKRQYIFSIIEMDIDLNDLQQLIQYRQKIQRNSLNYDEFIRKELSYKFEDVEYSVHSHSFLEKYYQNQLEKLYSIEQKKLFFQPFQQNKKTGYRYI